MPSISSPHQRYEGSGATNAMSAMHTTITAVSQPSRRCRPVSAPAASLRCPYTGATSATRMPDTVIAAASAAEPLASSPATELVR